MSASRVLVAGAGGFIGGHLVKKLLEKGCGGVVAVDVKPLDDWYQVFTEAQNETADLRSLDACREVMRDVEQVFNLAADMGGMGFIEQNRALCMMSVLINTHMLMAAREREVATYFFSSSACVYPTYLQGEPENPGLKESDAYPALPEDGYGWEKLFSERMCRHFTEDFGLSTRVARYHNVYGPLGSWMGGREKAPAAICRKVAEAKLSGTHEIEIWGDGEQTRSFMYVDDCTHGTLALMHSDIVEPINIGSSEMVTINELVDAVERIAAVTLERRYNLDAPRGVRGRTSDNAMVRRHLGWEPSTPLVEGLETTFRWIFDQVAALSSVR